MGFLRRRRRRLLAVLAVLVVLLGVVTGLAIAGRSPAVHTRVQFVAGTPEAGRPVQLDTTLYLPATTPAPAVLLAHGFGGTKNSVAGEARSLAQHGYVVLAYTARGFGQSGGLIHLDAPRYEVHDASLLVTYLSSLPQVQRKNGKPEIGVGGSSYGGALALLLAGTDPRIEAVVADITWNNLATALFPNAATGGQAGVFKKMWAGDLFESALNPLDPSCGRFAADLCAAYQRAASTGQPDATILSLLTASSPSTVLDKITAPTLLSQGEDDSLFPLAQADANAKGISANGTPVKVLWRSGGHDSSTRADGTVTAATLSWLGDVFAGRVHGSQSFTVDVPGTAISAETGNAAGRVLRAAGYPGIDGVAPTSRAVRVSGPAATIAAPAGGNPAAVTSVPGLGGALSQVTQTIGSQGLDALPGQVAAFDSAPVTSRMTIVGAPTITLLVTTKSTTDATLFASLHDVSADGTDVAPANLVAPLRLTGLTPGAPTAVTVALPGIVRTIAAGHRLRLVISTTDLAYAMPPDARTYTVALTGGSAAVTLPIVPGSTATTGNPASWLITGVLACLLVALGVGLLLRRRRVAQRFAPDLADVPIAVTGLVKEYGDGYRAVDDVTFRVEKGQVVGLLGPNGAGKTTTLRVLVGLITPTAGTIHVFGQPVVPGAAVLARLGAFIEGPGFLPHLSGRDNLRLYWAASGREDIAADFETALEIAGLGSSVDRRVKTYSHGMKQRLGIAQAMLGLPEVLVLDEPTNGLDPPQIAEMREVLRSYAATGRTVVVSSHLLAEVEQTCTHVVVMHRGKLVAAGSVSEIAGAGGTQLVVDDAERATAVLAAAGISAQSVPARRALEDVFLDLIGGERP
jgi:ABC-2 type transport system ATP-binding protein